MFFKMNRPILLGEISLETGYSLKTCEEQLKLLEEDNKTHMLTEKELSANKLSTRCNYWVAVDRNEFYNFYKDILEPVTR